MSTTYSVGSYVNILSHGLLQSTESPTATTADRAEWVKLSFYTVSTSGDGSSSETLLHSNIDGYMELSTVRQVKETFHIPSRIYTFMPGRWLTGLKFGMKAIDEDETIYVVEDFCEYSTHQEITLKRM